MKLKYLLLLAFVSTITISACSDDNKDPLDEEVEETKFTGVYPMVTAPDNNEYKLPISWSSYEWYYEEDELVSFTAKHSGGRMVDVVAHTETTLEANGTYKNGDETEVSLNTVKLENGLVKNYSLTYMLTDRIGFSINHDYHHNAQGYLESVTGTTKSGYVTTNIEMLLMWENGNIAQIEAKENSELKATYRYTYDDKEYIPMSDFTVYTPIYFYAPYPLIEFYTKLGKQNKNNIKEVNIEYPEKDLWSKILKITYETILNKNGTVKQINHTGVYYHNFSAENRQPVSFKELRTHFQYTAISK